MLRPSRFLLCWFLAIDAVGRAQGKSFRPICEIKSEPVEIYRDPVTGTYVSVEDASDEDQEDHSLSRRLKQTGRLELPDDSIYWTSAFMGADKMVRKAQRVLEGEPSPFSPPTTFMARYCECKGFNRFPSKDPVYCPMDTNYCGYPRHIGWEGEPLACLYVPKGVDFCRNSMWVMIAWFGTIFATLACSVTGRHFVDGILQLFVPGWNKFLARRLERRDPERARFMMRRNLHQRRRVLDQQQQASVTELLRDTEAVIRLDMGTPQDNARQNTLQVDERQPCCLVLKTVIYQSTISGGASISQSDSVSVDISLGRSMDDDSNTCATDEHMCIICFQPLQQGDRVGDLACKHTFHVDCLKSWCVRRNCCPLCQSPDIADPIYATESQPCDGNSLPENDRAGESGSVSLSV